MSEPTLETLWQTLVAETREMLNEEPVLASFLYATILNHRDMASALSFHLASKLVSDIIPALQLREVFDRFCISRAFTRWNPTGWPTGCGGRAASPWPWCCRTAFPPYSGWISTRRR